MNPRLLALLLLALTAVSCDKVKSMAAKATAAMKEKIAPKVEATATPVDVTLEKLVDQTPEGAVFRKDLPFPTQLEVRSTRRQEISGRFYQSSAIDQRTDLPKGTRTLITKLERADDQIRYTLEQSAFALPTADTPEAAKQSATKPGAPNPPVPNKPVAGKQPAAPPPPATSSVPPPGDPAPAPPAQPVTFRKTGHTWGADQRVNFRAVALAQELSPVFDQLLVENALVSRPLWFAKRRFKVGDQLIVTGESLPMLLAGDAKGSLTLKLESFEPVAGHPCGVFSVTGDYRRKNSPDFEGNRIDEDVTIRSGKLWLSLIYPVILREELDTIQTLKSGSAGGLVTRGQGSIKISVTRAWKRLKP